MFFLFDIILSPYVNPLFILNSLNSKETLYPILISIYVSLFFNMPFYLPFIFIILIILDKYIKNFYLKNIINYIVTY